MVSVVDKCSDYVVCRYSGCAIIDFMNRTERPGFTVIEVMLFLAITGVMLMVVFIGMGSQISRTRFNDGVRSTQAYFQKRYNDVATGVNYRGENLGCNATTVTVSSSSPKKPGKTDCIMMGQVITFDTGSDELVAYPVVGSEPTNEPQSNASIGEIVAAYNPTVVMDSSTTERYTLPWGAKIERTCRGVEMNTVTEYNITGNCSSSADAGIDAFLLLRSPISSSVMSYAFPKGSELGSSRGIKLTKINDSTGYIDFQSTDYQKPVNICIASATSGLYGAIRLGGSAVSGQSGMVAVADLDAAGMEATCRIL